MRIHIKQSLVILIGRKDHALMVLDAIFRTMFDQASVVYHRRIKSWEGIDKL